MNAAPTVDLHLDLGLDQSFWVVAATLREGMSQITHASFTIASNENLDLEGVLTGEAVVTAMLQRTPSRYWTLKVGSIRFVEAKADTLRYQVELYSHLWLLRFASNVRKFRKQSAQDIITKIFSECGVPHRWEITRPTPRRNYCVQYHETNLDFVRRLMEFEGIYFTYDDDGTTVLGDKSSSLPEVPGQTFFELVEAENAMTAEAEGIYGFRRGSASVSGKATVNDFDWKKPSTKLITSQSTTRNPFLEIYDYPTGYRNMPDGQYLAQIRLEALQVPGKYVSGHGSVHRFQPGRMFSFGADAGELFAGEYLLLRVIHTYHNPAFDNDEDDGIIYVNEFEGIPRDVSFRPPITMPRPNISGYHTVMVRGPIGEEIWTDKMGRFRAQFHWDREAKGTDEDSRWLRVAQESASSMFLARVGWEMNVAYIDGDPDRPLGLARDINGVMVPTYGQPGNKTRMTIKTPTSPSTGGFNEIRLEDSAGKMEFYVKAERDLMNVVLNDRSETVGNNETRLIEGLLQETVEHDQQIKVGSNSTTTLSQDLTHQVDNNRTVTVGGNEIIKIGKSDTVTIEGDDTENVGAVRLTIAGSVAPPDPKKMAKDMLPSPEAAAKGAAKGALKGAAGGGGMAGAAAGAKGALKGMMPSAPTAGSLASQLLQGGINRTGTQKLTRMVGGAYINTALGNITTTANWGFAEVVGGAKITVSANGSIAQTVGGPLITAVGGIIARKAGDDISYSAPKSSVTVGATCLLKSDEKLKIVSDGTIEITAPGGFTLAQGGSSIKMAASGVTVTGDTKLIAKNKVTVTGKTDNVAV